MENKNNPVNKIPYEPLTKREKEILALVVNGLSNRKIAETLFIAHSTVRWYLRQIYSKIGVETREQAIEFGLKIALDLDSVDLELISNENDHLATQVRGIVGSRVAGRYLIRAELGAGAMGTVYQALDTQNNQVVAIKQLKPDIANPELIERFQREGEILRDLNHPNIVKMIDSITLGEEHYLIMEYVSGGDLAIILQDNQLPFERILKIAIELADALTRAHYLNVIHRDIKPGNILIAEDGSARLTDFGFARMIDKERITDADAILGTIYYLAPETFEGMQRDERSDIWSFGVLLFEMLTGEYPFKDDNVVQIINAIMHESVPDLEALRPDIPIALIDLVYRMLERDRQTRISSVRIIGAELEAIIQGRDYIPHLQFDSPAHLMIANNNLPVHLTPFIGRNNELDELENLLKNPTNRLITILGQGGMGKTSLSLELARRLSNTGLYKDGIYFVDLAILSDPDNIPNAIGSACGFQFLGEGTPKAQLLSIIRERNLLLILDNYEHLSEGYGLVSDMLKSAPDVNIVATSRQPLSQAGETLFFLSGMELSDGNNFDDALRFDAIQLFVNSAKRANPSFELTIDNYEAVGEICNIVHGMPLAIILAGSWLSVLSVFEISNEIKTGIDFLKTEEASLPKRQRSIQAVMDYSWRQMTEPEQDVFLKMSIFRGGFTREAAQIVADAGLRLLMSFVKKSLIRRNVNNGRYEIHELLRQFVAQKLDSTSNESVIRMKHSVYYAESLYQIKRQFRGKEQVIALNIIEIDIENIRVGWRYAIENERFDLLGKYLESLYYFFSIRSRAIEGLEMIGLAVSTLLKQKPSESLSPLIAKVLARQGSLTHRLGQYDLAKQLLVASLNILETTDLREEIAFVLNNLADVERTSGQYEAAKQLCGQSLTIFRELNDQWSVAATLNNLGVVLYYLGDFLQAQQYYLESLDISKHLDNGDGAATALVNLGAIAHDLGNYEEAQQYYLESMELCKKLDDQDGIIASLINLGRTSFILESYLEATQYSEEGLLLSKKLGNQWGIAASLINIGDIAYHTGNLANAKQYFSEALNLVQEIHAKPLLLEVIVAIMDLLAYEGNIELIFEMLLVILDEPIDDKETWERIEKLRINLIANLPNEITTSIRENPRFHSLTDLVEHIFTLL